MGNWTRTLWCVNTLEKSSSASEQRLGRNVIGGFIFIIERWRRRAPDSFREMEPLFLAVVCGCNAGLYRDALHEIYLERIQRGDASFAANVLGARGVLLSVLTHFFEPGRWGSPVQTDVAGQSLTEEDHSTF